MIPYMAAAKVFSDCAILLGGCRTPRPPHIKLGGLPPPRPPHFLGGGLPPSPRPPPASYEGLRPSNSPQEIGKTIGAGLYTYILYPALCIHVHAYTHAHTHTTYIGLTGAAASHRDPSPRVALGVGPLPENKAQVKCMYGVCVYG